MKKILKHIKNLVPESIQFKIKNLKYARKIRKIEKSSCKDLDFSVSIVLAFAENWNSYKSFYEVCRCMNIKCVVIATPYLSNGKIDFAKYAETCDFLTMNSVEFIKAFSEDGKAQINYLSIATNYVFYDEPYNFYPDDLSFSLVSNVSKICYIPYGFILTDSEPLLRVVLSDQYLQYNYLFFASWSGVYNYAINRYIYLGNKRHYVKNLGYPRFDLIHHLVTTHKGFTILWTPRWETPKGVNSVNNTAFSSLEYTDFIIKRIENGTEKWIVRPHPRAFKAMVENGLMSIEDVQNFVSKISSFDNSMMDSNRDYMESFLNSDCLITDFSSLIVEYSLMDKPIIYCGDIDAIPIKSLKDSMYLAKSWSEVEQFVSLIKSGNDPLSSFRKRFVDEMNIENNIGERIFECLKEDFNRKDRKA